MLMSLFENLSFIMFWYVLLCVCLKVFVLRHDNCNQTLSHHGGVFFCVCVLVYLFVGWSSTKRGERMGYQPRIKLLHFGVGIHKGDPGILI